MNETLTIALITAITSGGTLAFIQYLITRKDNKEDKKNGIQAALSAIKIELESIKTDMDKKFKKTEKDNLRTQMLVMICWRPKEKKEILTLGERYFSDPPKGLGANWYMTDIFNKWLEDEGHSKPEWFRTE